MHVMTLSAAFEDDRGTITDLMEGQVDAVTVVTTRAGAIRGNHLHERTAQWAYVLSGRMEVVTGTVGAEVAAGHLIFNPAGEPHAWRAIEDTVCVVFVKGPRAGRAYESDTTRLQSALIEAS